jgi:hypothetical protein
MQTSNSNLDPNWVTTGLLDFEFKKYILLDYMQKCQAAFHATKLYPPLSDLCLHYKNLIDLQNGLESMENHFPKALTGMEVQKVQWIYQENQMKNQEIETIQEIIDFALPLVKKAIADGKDIYECVEQHLAIQPVGLIPLYKNEGYLLIHVSTSPDVFVYKYHQSYLVMQNERYRQLQMDYVTHTTLSFTNTLENIKLDLIRHDPSLPQPATFDCVCGIGVPLQETLLPIAQRAALQHLAHLD